MSILEIIRTETSIVRIMVLDKDSSSDWLYHIGVSVYFVCLKGMLQVEIRNNDEPATLHPGERIEIKTSEIHRIINIHDGQSEYLWIHGAGQKDI